MDDNCIIKFQCTIELNSKYEKDRANIIKIGFRFNLVFGELFFPCAIETIGNTLTLSCIATEADKKLFKAGNIFSMQAGPNVLGEIEVMG